jgi:hypothetical protein
MKFWRKKMKKQLFLIPALAVLIFGAFAVNPTYKRLVPSVLAEKPSAIATLVCGTASGTDLASVSNVVGVLAYDNTDPTATGITVATPLSGLYPALTPGQSCPSALLYLYQQGFRRQDAVSNFSVTGFPLVASPAAANQQQAMSVVTWILVRSSNSLDAN